MHRQCCGYVENLRRYEYPLRLGSCALSPATTVLARPARQLSGDQCNAGSTNAGLQLSGLVDAHPRTRPWEGQDTGPRSGTEGFPDSEVRLAAGLCRIGTDVKSRIGVLCALLVASKI